MMTFEAYRNLMDQLSGLIEALSEHSDEATREQVLALLGGIDTLHREGLTRLVATMREAGLGAMVEGDRVDPIVETLLGLYDIVDLDLPEDDRAEAPPARGGFVPIEDVQVLGDALPDGHG